MSSKTTVTLDDDVLERVKAESAARGKSVDEAVNEILRAALGNGGRKAEERPFEIKPFHMGPPPPGLNTDCTEEMLEFLEGPFHL